MQKRFLQMMKKRAQSLRLFSLLVCLGMLLPAVGWGQSLIIGDITVDVRQDGYWTTDEAGKLTETEDAQNYNVFYDATSKILTLKNANITNVKSSVIVILGFNNEEFTIQLEGENTLTSTNENHYLIQFATSVKIAGSGDGQLIGNAPGACIQSDSSGNLTIDNCIVNVTSSNGGGIHGGTLTLQNNAQVTVESKGTSLSSDNAINITDSKVTATSNGAISAIRSHRGITINHSTVEVSYTSEDGGVAIYSYKDIMVENGSEVTVTDGCSQGFLIYGDMTIKGSTVTASGSKYDGMYVQRTLTVVNSTLAASGNPNDIMMPAIQTANLDITASEVTAQGGIHLNGWYGTNTDISFSITPAEGKLAEFKVDDTNWDGSAAIHFREEEDKESPYDTKVDFSAASMDRLSSYRYIHIGEQHVHRGERIDAKEATCTEPGNIVYWRCACGKCYSDEALTKEISIEETVIPAGHNIVKVEAKAPTCTEDGNKEYWYCDRCGKYFSDEAGTTEINLEDVVIPATGHHYVNGYCTECGHRDPDYRPDPDPISYYNIYVEEVCDGVEVTTSKNVVREGGSITVSVEKDTTNYTFDDFKVYYKRSYYGGWEELKEGTQPDEYPIKNIWTHIYIKAEGAEKKKDPTGNESIEGVTVYTKDGSL